jgi:hypothetical protein
VTALVLFAAAAPAGLVAAQTFISLRLPEKASDFSQEFHRSSLSLSVHVSYFILAKDVF